MEIFELVDGVLQCNAFMTFTLGIIVLFIAMFRMDNKELVWEGTGSRPVDPSSGPERREQRINDVVKRILEGFPPGIEPGT